MNEELKKEAEALIEFFKRHIKVFSTKFLNSSDEESVLYYSKELAIDKCQSIIKELELMDKCIWPISNVAKDRITHYQSLIKQIEIQ